MLLKSGKMGLQGNIIFKMDKNRTESDAGCNKNKKTLKRWHENEQVWEHGAVSDPALTVVFLYITLLPAGTLYGDV